MNEDFLYYVWQYKLFSGRELFTTKNERITMINSGVRNQNSGPDFLNAKVKIDEVTWSGHVEMHVNSSDWYLHNHEEDKNYDAVILHVVWEHDADIFLKENQVLPTLELKSLVKNTVLNNYKNLLFSQQNWIPCEKQIDKVEDFYILSWKERLYFERLEQKASVINDLLKLFNGDYEAVLFLLLAKNFGLKVNGASFFELAKSIDFSIIRKVRFDKLQLSALLFGQAGFLEDEIQNDYHQLLKKEYTYLRHKYQLSPLHKNTFQFFRMRPNNFPTIRIAQLVALFFRHQNMFSELIKLKNLKAFYDFFKIEVDEFWETRFTFEKESKKSSKSITKAMVDLLVINTIIPLKFVYLKNKGQDFEEDILQLIQQISFEKNSIVSKFSKIGVKAKDAMESQALIELKNNYCTKKRCLQCAIGLKLLKNE